MIQQLSYCRRFIGGIKITHTSSHDSCTSACRPLAQCAPLHVELSSLSVYETFKADASVH